MCHLCVSALCSESGDTFLNKDSTETHLCSLSSSVYGIYYIILYYIYLSDYSFLFMFEGFAELKSFRTSVQQTDWTHVVEVSVFRVKDKLMLNFWC